MLNKAKKPIAWLVTLALAIAILAGSFASIQLVSAAKGGDFVSIIGAADKAVIVNKVEYGKNFTVPLDDDKYDTTVKAPNGSAATVEATADPKIGSITADQLGIYEVTLTDNYGGDLYGWYKYNVECYIDGDYFLSVYKGGATIPSYWEMGETDVNNNTINLEIPDANVYQYDEKEEIYLMSASQSVFVKVTKPNGEEWLYKKSYTDGVATVSKSVDGGAAVTTGINTDFNKGYIDTFSLSDKNSTTDLGIWFFTYYTGINDGKEIISHEYRMQVQKQFEDTKAPDLPNPNVSGYASVNTKVTLPKATPTDNFDDRVIVDITVKHNGKDVPVVVSDVRTGYAVPGEYKKSNNDTTTSENEAARALFDNDMFMYFYPVAIGDYFVTYQAKDTSNYYKVNNKTYSAVYNFRIEVRDLVAPVVERIDDWKIPSEWSANVYQYKENDTSGNGQILSNTNIEFPIPETYDNKDGSGDLGISFNMTDSTGHPVAYFSNINVTSHTDAAVYEGDGELKTDNYYFFDWSSTPGYSVDPSTGSLSYDDGTGAKRIGYDFRTAFNFSLWSPKYNNASKAGTYNITYTIYDVAGNETTLKYSIQYRSTDFKDTGLPSVYFSAPKFLSFRTAEEETSISDVSATDTQTSRVHSEYYLVFNSSVNNTDVDSENFDDILNSAAKPGDVIELDSTLGSNTIKTQKSGTSCDVEVRDILRNNVKLNVNVKDYPYAYVMLRATDAAGNVSVALNQLRLIDASAPALSTVSTIEAVGTLNANNAIQGTEYKIGSFEVTFAGNDRLNTGFELYIQRIANGEDLKNEGYVSNVKFETYSKNDGNENKVHIDNVRFTPSDTGTYMLVIRGYHISGLSTVSIYYITSNLPGGSTGGGSDPKPPITEAKAVNSLPDDGNLNVTYSLNTKFDTNGVASYVVRSISGGRMSLMYDQLTAKSSGAYSFTDYTVPSAGIENAPISYNPTTNIPVNGKSEGNYSIKITDSETPVIKLQSAMPVYSKLDGTVTLPKVAAYSSNGIAAKVDVSVTYKSETIITADDTRAVGEKLDYGGEVLGGNSYSFVTSMHGTYTVSYSATLNGNVANASFTIKAGDVVPPAFSVVDSTTASGTANQSVLGFINDRAVSATSSALAKVGNTFKFGVITVQDEGSLSGYKYSKKLIASNGETVGEPVTTASLRDNGTAITFTMSGTYTVEYSVTDAYDNTTTIYYYITINSTTTNVSTDAIRTLSIVLIIVGIILIAGVVIYLVRFRKHKR